MRKIAALLLVSIWSCMALFAQSIPDWENPEVFAINKEAARATSIPYPSEELAIEDDYASSPFYHSLNGNWKFYWVPKVADVPEGFYEESYDASGWVEIPVPGNWEFNGYGVPIYVSAGFGFRSSPPRIDREDSPTGAYRHEFTIPDSWEGRRVFLHFEAGTNSMYVWVNGQKVGYTQNSKSPAEFDITPYIRKGKNMLACEVHKFSDGSYLEDQDMWRLGGINRNVYLYSTDQSRLLDFFAHPDLDKNYRNGRFSVEVTVKNYSSQRQNHSVEVSLLDKSGKKVFSRRASANVPGGGTTEVALSGNVSNPLKWTAETPHLYTMLITLKNNRGELIEATSHKVGFRKIEITDGQLFINGKKVFFKGVNLHEFNYRTGQVVTREVMMRNLQLMKELNINAVRTSHYPQPPLWYKLCDEYGIYLVDEANMESHGLGYGPDNVANFPEWHAQHMDRVIRLVERDKNHASVIFWSLGNEASNGKAFFDMYDWAKARDSSRPVQYEQAYQIDRNSDIICHMYPSWENMKRDAAKDLGRPYIMCEYAHAMGNSMGNFQEYWDLMRSSKNMQGGFIWEWYNHGYPAHDEQGRFYWAYGGDLKGYDRRSSGNFCMDGIISPDQNYVPHTYIVKKVYQDILFEASDLENGVITVVNDYKFTDLTPESHSYKWVLLKNGEAFAEGSFDLSLKADSRKEVKLNLPAITKEEGVEYFLQLFAYSNRKTELLPAGFEVAKGEFAIGHGEYFAAVRREGTLSVEQGEGKTVVNAGDLSYEFASQDGQGLISMRQKGQNVFQELPRLNFWRALTDNEYGERLQYSARVWESAGYNTLYSYKGSRETADGFIAEYEVKPRGIEAKVHLTYTVNRDGSLTVSARYTALSDDLPEMVRFGMMMTLPVSYDHFTWYGRGPGESYVDRKDDAFMGVWSGKVGEQAFAYYRPQETGNKMDVRWLTLENENGNVIRVEGAQPLSVSATHNKPEDLDPGVTKKQQHASDILPRSEVVLCVDLFQRGVGGLHSWGAKPLDAYRFMDKEYTYSYTISVNP